MSDNNDALFLLRTKLHRPQVPNDLLHRARLMERLQKSRHRPLTLVSAPAGYGKSTLVSCWLEMCDSPSAWLSLDESDNDLQQFLTYFIAAFHTIFPDTANKTSALVNAPIIPPLLTLASSLANELEAVEQDFILVLDDIQYIRERSVHDFLNMLLRHPPRPMQLVLIGRRDPFLSITDLRARSKLSEIRHRDLQFTVAETTAYLQNMLKLTIPDDLAAACAEKMEGWVTGLRLAALSIRHRGDLESLLPELQGGTHYIMEYLFSEILSHQPTDIREYLLKTSILDRFCAPLCDSLSGAANRPGKEKTGGWYFIARLKKENLFVINLDAEGHWYRYHHLFQQLLQNQLKRYHNADEIAELHSLAGRWFESHGLITEAIEHALAAGDNVRAAEIVEDHRVAKQEVDQWYVVARWIAMIPVEIQNQRPLLLLIQAWICYERSQVEELVAILERLEKLLDVEGDRDTIFGELCFFKGYFAYFKARLRKVENYLKKLWR